jgi:hypothetical protein
MTVGDLFSGAWTWGLLFNEIGPIVMVAAAAFYAGYERGQRIAYERTEALIDLTLGGKH